MNNYILTMDSTKRVSLISRSFWYSFFGYYFNFLKRVSNKTIKFSSMFIFNYGFDVMLLTGKIIIYNIN